MLKMLRLDFSNHFKCLELHKILNCKNSCYFQVKITLILKNMNILIKLIKLNFT